MTTKILTTTIASLSVVAGMASQKPNIVIVYADDISAREFPVYESSVWSPPNGGNTSDINYRAKTPVMEELARKGVIISTCWAAPLSSPSRAQMMTGRYASTQKWWLNGDCGKYKNPTTGKQETWPLFESSPLQLGRVAQKGGYATVWAGKTQMSYTDVSIDKYGFDEGCYTPGDLSNTSPYTDFKMTKVKGEERTFKVEDSGALVHTYLQTSYYWMPSVMIVNHPSLNKNNKMVAWPNTPEAKKNFSLNSFSADIEQDYVFDFMERKHAQKQPFFVYHTTHLGHDSYNFINPESESFWPQTPKVKWDGKKYIRTNPNITGDKGKYNTHNSLAEEGMHNHVNYIDYIIWRYTQKFEQMGIADNTILIIAADNGTLRYGKGSPDRQKGLHVPLIIYAPCLKMPKHGTQQALVNIADILPTGAEIAGVNIPKNYNIDGVSLMPFLTTDKTTHRDWIYGYRAGQQLIRGDKVMLDGFGKWWDVSSTPEDLISFRQITDWSKVSDEHRKEKKELEAILPRFDNYATEYNGPGGTGVPKFKNTIKKNQ